MGPEDHDLAEDGDDGGLGIVGQRDAVGDNVERTIERLALVEEGVVVVVQGLALLAVKPILDVLQK